MKKSSKDFISQASSLSKRIDTCEKQKLIQKDELISVEESLKTENENRKKEIEKLWKQLSEWVEAEYKERMSKFGSAPSSEPSPSIKEEIFEMIEELEQKFE